MMGGAPPVNFFTCTKKNHASIFFGLSQLFVADTPYEKFQKIRFFF